MGGGWLLRIVPVVRGPKSKQTPVKEAHAAKKWAAKKGASEGTRRSSCKEEGYRQRRTR
jgi:hypothetical protein